MRFITTILAVALSSAAVVLAASTTAVSSAMVPAVNTTVNTAASNCGKSTRYACGQYMLADGSRQDFVSQVPAVNPTSRGRG
ncbi:hypothetical protein BDU57DRAFT_518197 [Ampelomyces quisqualis]|uniref:Uncharacterized protein n=1 Tax=Ampelomyces quisqualis TaxID=50730 RepID=A0A6A5QKU9_AMPQU|nr:hypothetical protein BDU57DRAFT_518197 [Ampelomyces quisqualis]